MIPPQIMLTMAQIASKKQNELNQKVQNKLQEIPSILGGFGNIASQMSLSEDGNANVGMSALGGSLQGAASLSALGPLGMIGGLLLGGATGYMSANKSNADYFDKKDLEDSLYLSGKTINPSIYGAGGLVDMDALIPAQMDKDEMYVTPGLKIFKSKSKSTHEKMDRNQVTDVLAPKSFVFSNRKKFVPKNHMDEILGYGIAYYNEDEDTFELEEVKMKDVFSDSKKPMSYSKGAEIVKKKFKTVKDDKAKDLLTEITNQENLQARLPYLTKLIGMHQKDNRKVDKMLPLLFGDGGMPYEKLYAQLAKLQGRVKNDYTNTITQGNALFDKLNLNSGLGALTEMTAIGLQSTQVNPRLHSSIYSDNMFEEISPATSDQMASNVMDSVNSTIRDIAQENPELALKLAPKLMDSALTKSNDARLRVMENNYGQRRGKYTFLNNVTNQNNMAKIEADETTKNLLNKKTKMMADTFNQWLSHNNDYLTQKYEFENKALQDFNKSENTMFQNEVDLRSSELRDDIYKKYYEEFIGFMNKKDEKEKIAPIGINNDIYNSDNNILIGPTKKTIIGDTRWT